MAPQLQKKPQGISGLLAYVFQMGTHKLGPELILIARNSLNDKECYPAHIPSPQPYLRWSMYFIFLIKHLSREQSSSLC
jgi:hypothetical protein